MRRAAYLREQAAKFRELASTESSVSVRDKLVALAKQCEQLASSIDGTSVNVLKPESGGAAKKPE
jgi:hypothetical protein